MLIRGRRDLNELLDIISSVDVIEIATKVRPDTSWIVEYVCAITIVIYKVGNNRHVKIG